MEIDIHKLVPGCKYFRWKELLYLPKWKIHCYPSDKQYLNLIELCKRADMVRQYIDKPMFVTSGIRPDKYNTLIGGSRFSRHKIGQAMDFQCKGLKADKIRELLIPVLDDFNIRMENLPGSNWVHIDFGEPGPGGRFFNP